MHHYPIRFLSKQFCALTAVHAANVIEHELQPDNQRLLNAVADTNYLNELQLADRLEMWRDLCKEKLL